MKRLALCLPLLMLAGCEVTDANKTEQVSSNNAMEALERSADNLDANTDAEVNQATADILANDADNLELAIEDNSAAPANAVGNSASGNSQARSDR